MSSDDPADSTQIRFDERGLAPCVIQDASTGEVLTLAYVNAEALQRTQETGEMHLWSRSRDELWHKGATSGNVQRVRELRYDCDADAVLALVDPAGPACHTGERTCFHRALRSGPGAAEVPEAVSFEALPELERTLEARRAERPEGSYTAQLLADPELIGAKVRRRPTRSRARSPASRTSGSPRRRRTSSTTSRSRSSRATYRSRARSTSC